MTRKVSLGCIAGLILLLLAPGCPAAQTPSGETAAKPMAGTVPPAPFIAAIKAFITSGDIQDYQSFGKLFELPVEIGQPVFMGPRDIQSKAVGIVRKGDSPVIESMGFLYNLFPDAVADAVRRNFYPQYHVRLAELYFGPLGLEKFVCVTGKAIIASFGPDDTKHPTSITEYDHKFPGRNDTDIYINAFFGFNGFPMPLDKCASSISISQYALVNADGAKSQ